MVSTGNALPFGAYYRRGKETAKEVTQRRELWEKNSIPGKIPVFTLQGNFNIEKLHGMYKMMMSIMVKTAGKALEKKTDRTPEEEDMLDMMLHGGERVRIQNLQGVISWYNGKR